MKLNNAQLTQLIALTISTQAETIGCDGCYELLDQFAQAELDGRDVPRSLEAVRVHLTQCKCCQDEYAALLAALRELDS